MSISRISSVSPVAAFPLQPTDIDAVAATSKSRQNKRSDNVPQIGSPLNAGADLRLDPELKTALDNGATSAAIDRIEMLNSSVAAKNQQPLTTPGVKKLIATEDAEVNRRVIDGKTVAPTHTAAVYYVVDRNGANVDIYTLATSPTHAQPFFNKVSMSTEEFEELRTTTINAAVVRSLGRRLALHPMAEVLVEPMQAWLKQGHINQLLVVPSGELMNVPLAILAVENDQNVTSEEKTDDHDYLFEHYTLAQVSSVTSLADIDSHHLRHDSTVAIATSTINEGDVSWFEREAEWVRHTLPGSTAAIGTVRTVDDLEFTRHASIVILSFHSDAGGLDQTDESRLLEPSLDTGHSILITDDLKKLYAHSAPRLLVLNGCESARSGLDGLPSMALSLTEEVDTVIGGLFATEGAADFRFTKYFLAAEQGRTMAERVQAARRQLSRDPGFEHTYYYGAQTLYGSPWLR